MNKENQTKEYLEKLKQIKLSDSSRARMESSLLEYARFHGVRVPEGSRSIEQVPQRTSLFRLKYTYMPIAILIALMVGGGTSYAAQGAVPGDFLYPVKTEVNENVRAAFAVSAEAEAELQADLIAERLEEAQELQAEGRLDEEATETLTAELKVHAEKAALALDESTDENDVATIARISATVGQFNILLNTDGALTIDLSDINASVYSDTSFGTSLSLEPISVEMLKANTEARITALETVVNSKRAELSAKAYAEFEANLAASTDLMVKAETQAETEARNTLFAASDMLGQIESKISTLGTVKVDIDTGAIVDVDFSIVPPREYGAEEGSQNDNSSESVKPKEGTIINTDTDTDTSVDLDLNVDNSKVDVNGAASSVINL